MLFNWKQHTHYFFFSLFDGSSLWPHRQATAEREGGVAHGAVMATRVCLLPVNQRAVPCDTGLLTGQTHFWSEAGTAQDRCAGDHACEAAREAETHAAAGPERHN